LHLTEHQLELKEKPGSNLPIKVIVQDSSGVQVDSVDLTAFVTRFPDADAGTEAPFDEITCENTGTTEFDLQTNSKGDFEYSCVWDSPESSPGIYYVTIFSSHPNNDANPELLVLADNPHCVGDLEDTDECPELEDLDPNDPSALPNLDNIEEAVSLRVDLGADTQGGKGDSDFCDKNPEHKKCQ